MIERRKRLTYYVLGSIFLAFVLLSVLVTYPTLPIDHEFSREVQENQHPLLDILMRAVSWLGYRPQSILLPLGVSLIFLLFKMKREALFVALTLISGVLGRFLKILIDRPRPTEDLVRIIDKAKYQSFPSGHVLLYVVFFGFLIVLMNRLKNINFYIRVTVALISAFFIIAVPFSRIYLGAHWFTDVLGSFLLGTLCLFPLSYFYLKKSKV